MAPTDNVRVPWQFHGNPQTYALAVRLYLADLAKRLISAPEGKTPLSILMEDMQEVGGILPDLPASRRTPEPRSETEAP
jgi:hypothetical protein